jgi:hypothetical protein
MATVSIPPTSTFEPVLNHEIDDLLLQLRGLVMVRDLLVERGATPAEVAAHTQEAERVRVHLKELLAA